MRACFVVNNVKTQRPTYTTLHLGYEAWKRGHDVRFMSVDAFSYGDDNRVLGLTARPPPRKYASPKKFCRALVSDEVVLEEACLNEFDVVFLRNNPSVAAQDSVDRFNPAIDFGRRLKRNGVMVINDPDGLLRAGSKMYLAGFPKEIRPKTLVSRNVDKIKEFLRELDGPAIIKPLSGFGGQNVFYVRRGQVSNLNQMIQAVRKEGYVIAQEYLPQVARGDKRVLLLRGEPIRLGKHAAAYKRMRPKDDIRNNMHVGGIRKRCEFSDVEERICSLLRPRLVTDGLYFVGVDVVGDRILEINVFAPGGIHNINELYGVNVGQVVVEDLERKVEVRTAYQDTLASDAWIKS
ncbi:MAG: glutathione synthase [Deltaproteobacteria bacterium]|nr:glutathione synthase [Deltaproteobacteria bacterium]